MFSTKTPSIVISKPKATPSAAAHRPIAIPSDAMSIDGDPTAAGLYKARRYKKKVFCKYNAHQIAKCWAFTNLVISVLDVMYSLYEILATMSRLMDTSENNSLHRTLFLISSVMHGDCTETPVEVVINCVAELMYVISSILFAFATMLEKEDFLVARCLVQWFIFSVWFPPLALIPRFFLNIVSTCGINSSRAYGPNWNEHGPRIVFWITNLMYLFFLVAWLGQGRKMALNFVQFLKEEEQKQSAKFLNSSSSLTINHVGEAGDKALKRSALGGMLPPSTVVL